MELATMEGLPVDLAREFFERKANKKGAEDLVYRLVEGGSFSTDGDARRATNRLWRNYRRHNETGAIVTADGKEVYTKQKFGLVDQFNKPSEYTYLDQARDYLEKLIGPIGEVEKKEIRGLGGREVVAGDFHEPFVDEYAFEKLMSDPAETAWLVGDFTDFISATRHRQAYDWVTVRAELAASRAALEALAKKFNKVTIVEGNHDKRPRRRLQDVMPGLLPLFIDPVVVLAAGLDNVEIISREVQGTAPNLPGGENTKLDFMGTVGDCLFGHFENFCGEEAPRQVENWIQEWSHILKLENEPRAIFQAHTHRLGMSYTPKGRLLVATGCMCRPMEYQFANHGKYKPPVPGYVAVFRGTNGLLKLEETQLIPCVKGF